jgi:hypothetical protein
MAKINYRPQMEQITIEELLDIIDFEEPDGYAPEAIAAARDELARRNISVNELNDLRSRRIASKKVDAEPFPFTLKVQFFLLSFGSLPSGLINGILMLAFGVRLGFFPALIAEIICFTVPIALAANQARRRKRAFLWMLYGFLFWGIVFWVLRVPILAENASQYQTR